MNASIRPTLSAGLLRGRVRLSGDAALQDSEPVGVLPLRRLSPTVEPIVSSPAGTAEGVDDLCGSEAGNVVFEGHRSTIAEEKKSAMPKIVVAQSRQCRQSEDMKEPLRYLLETPDTRAKVLDRLHAAMATTLAYLKREHRDYLHIRKYAAEAPQIEEFQRMMETTKTRRENLRDEARRLRWIACGRSLSERRREARAIAEWETQNSQSNNPVERRD